MFKSKVLTFSFTLLVLLVAMIAKANIEAAQNETTDTPTVGIEGAIPYKTDNIKITPVPFNEKAKLVLRIAGTPEENDGKLIHDLRFIGMVPGDYDVRNFLVREDGSATSTLPLLIVKILPLLPEDHDGLLNADELSPFGVLGGYKVFATLFIIFWIATLLLMIFYGNKKEEEVVVEVKPPPTLAELLRPLVQRAAAGVLDTAGKAELERLMLKHWRKKLNLEKLTAGDALHKMRENSETGPFLLEVEKWLHRKPGTVTADVDKVLEPFQKIRVESE